MNVKALQHHFDNNLANNSCQHHRKVINLQKLDKKRQLSQSLSWISRIKQRLWGRDGNPTGDGQARRGRGSPAKEEKKEEKCSTLPRNVRLGECPGLCHMFNYSLVSITCLPISKEVHVSHVHLYQGKFQMFTYC